MPFLIPPRSKLILVFIATFLVGTPFYSGGEETIVEETMGCIGPFKDGRRPNLEKFKRVLKEHKKFMDSIGKGIPEGKRANLCKANLSENDLTEFELYAVNLSGANLSGSDLSEADLRRANLSRANLSGSDLSEADLRGAILSRAHLPGANLSNANLTNAYLSKTNLVEADLAWANLTEVDLTEANLSRARLLSATLFKADLTEANLTEANLSRAILSSALLGRANLAKADLRGSNLHGASLPEANLSRGYLHRANLVRARLMEANLSKANLSRADLTEADLSKANLSEARAEFTNFNSSTFDPSSVENLIILGAKGLSEIDFSNPDPIVYLRKRVRGASLRVQERALTSALRKYQLDANPNLRVLEGILLGGYLTDFGADPGLSIVSLFYIIVIFAFIYIVPLSKTFGKAGIWQVWEPSRIHKDEGKDEPIRLNIPRGLRLVQMALYFSFLSAFRFGWREINVGTWISRIQPHEYNLRATGWVRVLSGVQALLSLYLVALWALTYFGRPFE